MLGWQRVRGKGGICHQEHFASKRVGKHFKNSALFPAQVEDAQSLTRAHVLFTPKSI